MTDNRIPTPEFEVTAALTSDSPDLSGETKLVDPVSSRRGGNKIIRKLFRWKPPIWLEKVVVSAAIPVLTWVVAFLLFGEKQGLPKDGQIFALLVLMFLGIATGYAVELIKLPPLLGMLAIGMAMRNINCPGLTYPLSKNISGEASAALRQLALIVILIRAGLGLDPVALAKLSGVVIRLAFGPCIMEALTLGLCAHFLLNFPWVWGFLLGFVIAAVSPAVTVPCLLSLRDRGYGVAKGIPTIVIAAASVDDILAISAFGVTLGFAIAQKESLTMTLLQGPIEVALGITFAVVWGLALGLLLSRSEAEQGKEAVLFRMLFTFGGGCLSIFGFQYIDFPGSGALGCLGAAFVASVLWRQKGVLTDNDNLNWTFQTLWFVFQPLLFGLIGCEIDLFNLDANVVGFGLLCLAIALVVRIITSFFMVAGAGLSLNERFFIALAWLPKATVQAAIGSVALDLARNQNAGEAEVKLGLEVLTIAVLSILITAPVGAVAIMLAGPKLLSSDNSSEEDLNGGGSDTKRLTAGNGKKMDREDSTELVQRDKGNNGGTQDIMIQIASEDGITGSPKPT